MTHERNKVTAKIGATRPLTERRTTDNKGLKEMAGAVRKQMVVLSIYICACGNFCAFNLVHVARQDAVLRLPARTQIRVVMPNALATQRPKIG